MKVCIIAAIFHPYTRGGAEVVAEVSARAFREAGHAVSLLTIGPWQGLRSLLPRRESWNGLPAGKAGMTLHRFFPLNLFSFLSISKHGVVARLIWHALDMFNVHTYCTVKKWLKREKPDLILTHNLKGIGYTVPAAIRSFQKLSPTRYTLHATRSPWFHTLHDMGALHPTGLKIWRHEHECMQNNLLVRMYRRMNRRLFGSPDVVVSPSRFLLDEYLRAGFFAHSRCEVVKNPVQADSIAASRPAHPRFLYVGQLEPYKGIAVMLDAWRIISKRHSSAELVIAGDGSERDFVEDAAKKDASVRFLGRVPHGELAKVYAEAHCALLPSLAYENAPTSIAEAFASGTPVIASRIGGIPEMVENGVNGFLFEPGNAEDLARAMEEALASDRDALHRQARASVAIYSPAAYEKRLEKILREMTQKTAR
ncbi:MAG: glycosyltransferase family 4 protein [Patescibacteria group bacterium]